MKISINSQIFKTQLEQSKMEIVQGGGGGGEKEKRNEVQFDIIVSHSIIYKFNKIDCNNYLVKKRKYNY